MKKRTTNFKFYERNVRSFIKDKKIDFQVWKTNMFVKYEQDKVFNKSKLLLGERLIMTFDAKGKKAFVLQDEVLCNKVAKNWYYCIEDSSYLKEKGSIDKESNAGFRFQELRFSPTARLSEESQVINLKEAVALKNQKVKTLIKK